ncbi:MAG: seryl-tRNA synthetase [Epulopiscium sp.]|jgi:seryl-tRNA synthetase|uniref:serine--tRNA ligase n=1 Tax=Defluviitalea raffinosedens TaxID=1450156 RepID=UPI00195D4F3A|nr:serine--tRNA ligase [Defluviitalea raffinosedens]MBM7686036.1 seryl-tRNA synthetase [Defluviitalea raffinosedens]MDK2787008.1 seryl-tRNA synthetase [Candidatus Epulonipiscium sp.]
MLDVKLLRNNFEEVKEALKFRKEDFNLDDFLVLDEKRRAILQEVEQLKSKQNAVSKQVPILKKEGKDVSKILEEMKELSGKIKELDGELKEVDEKLENLLLTIPNIPHPSVPMGDSDEDNVEVRKFGTPRQFEFEPKPHWELGENLDILDFATAAKITGARFTVYKGLGARLERALMNFMLDVHTEKHGYEEVFPPFMVHRRSMIGTGQLPKFEEDAFKVENTDYFLVPTAEVPVTNMYRDQILDGSKLPIKHCAYTACFRAEAGSAGRDTRGVIRQHQFNKVELVKFTKPEDSYEELEKLTRDAEEILQLLEIPYRVVKICIGDLGFTAAMKYDIEVWMPSYNRYVEISSCSNFESFQARRANIKYKDKAEDKAQFVHTLNGSGVAIGRTTAAILENFQQEDGSIIIPKALRPYMGNVEKIAKK